MATVKIDLPYPPSINHYYRRVGNKTIISREGRRYRETVVGILREQGVPLLERQLDVTVEVFPPDRRRRDVDNVLKPLLDALQHGHLYKDDYQIVKLHIERMERVEGGVAIVKVQERKL